MHSQRTLILLLQGCLIGFLLWIAIFPSHASDWAPATSPLLTRWAANVSPTNAWLDYPRPQMVRPDWLNLNGLWDYAFTDSNAISPGHYAGHILVPFPVEAALSGVAQPLQPNGRLWYHRSFIIPPAWGGKEIRLNFGAVDWSCQVWVNQKLVGVHQGGYDAFSFNITSALNWNGPEDILVSVTDPTEGDQPRGKQAIKPEGVFYTSTSGIWQTAWLEPVPDICIDHLKMSPDLDAQGLNLEVAVANLSDNLEVEAIASVEGRVVGRVTGSPNSPLLLPVPDARLWSPDDPFLYNLDVHLYSAGAEVDAVKSYFGMRAISLKKDDRGRMGVALNHNLIFQIGVLDQGFWPDGIYTPPSDEAMRSDLEFLKRSGFNLVRKHVKVEPERWYYWCDHLGLLVWQDMPSANNTTPDSRVDFEVELRRMIEGRFNHPAIIQWNLFNEGWGQYDTERLVKEMHKLDQTRLIDNAAGWTDMRVGDVIDTHSYPEPPEMKSDPQRASVLGEYGGIGLRLEGHTWSSQSWGYQAGGSLEGVSTWYQHLMRVVWRLHDQMGLSASVYTQITDVETECNGLMTYDRAISKINPDVLRAANQPIPTSANGRVLLSNALNGDPAVWKYTLQQPATNWINLDFDDSGWTNGLAGFGSPDAPGAILNTLWNTDDIWLRRTFVLGDGEFSTAKFELHHGDDCEVFLNSVPAVDLHGFQVDYQPVDIPPLALQTLHPGTNLITAHCHRTGVGQYFDVGIFLPKNPAPSPGGPSLTSAADSRKSNN